MNATMLPSDFTIKVPDEWTPVPLDRDEARAAIDEAVQSWQGEAPSPDEVRQLKAVFGRMAVEAREAGIAFAASYVGILDQVENPETLDDGAPVADETGLIDPERLPRTMISATVALATLAAADISPTGHKVTEQALLEALAKPTAEGAQELRPPTVVHLPAGEAVETQVIEPFTSPEVKGGVPLLAIAYHLPLAGGEGLAVLSFRTPCLALGEEFRGLFRAIAETLEFTSED